MMYEYEFSYCPRCGSAMGKKGEKMLHCTACNLEYYVNPKACNALILENEKNEILLVKRAREPQKGWWDLPGGFVDVGETAEESVKREAKEELNIDIHSLQYIASAPDEYHYKGLIYNTICVVFYAKTDTKEFTPADDVSDYTFVAKKDLDITTIAFKGLRTVLKKYLAETS